jgi:CheY-like chemotaxis protein
MHHSVNSGRRVLCVDDNEAAVGVRAAVLEFHGYDVTVLTDERAVFDFLEREPIDILVLDYLMPEIRGDMLATMVRMRHPELPIVLISGAVDEPEDLGGADVFVSKSAGARRLLEVMHDMANRPKRNIA